MLMRWRKVVATQAVHHLGKKVRNKVGKKLVKL